MFSLVVSAPDTVVEPATVMVEVGHTLVTGTAVLRLWTPETHTSKSSFTCRATDTTDTWLESTAGINQDISI